MSQAEIRASRRCSRPRVVTMHPSLHLGIPKFARMLRDKAKPAQPVKVVPEYCRTFGATRRKSVDEAGARRLLECRGERAVFAGVGAGEHRDLLQVIFGLLAVALFELPEAVILTGPH